MKTERKKPSYIQLKVTVSETTPTGIVVLDALLSDDSKFLKQYGLGPKVSRANRLLWLAYLGITQANNSNSVSPITPEEAVDDLAISELQMTKVDEKEDEEDSLDENALMGGFI
jgi:uncharacterized protein YgfB (UPF0149 family)